MKKRLHKIFHYKVQIIVIFVIFLAIILSIIFNQKYCALGFTFIFLLFTYHKVQDDKKINKILKNIDEETLNLIESEIKNPLIKKRYSYLITEHYIIDTMIFSAFLLKYEDIVFVYRKLTFNFHFFSTIFVMVDKHNKKYKLNLESTKFPFLYDYPFIEDIIRKRNPNVLFGYNEENVSLIEEKYGFKIKK